ncbi:MAG: hypothetical protein ACR2MA_01380 [Egibacteraceae bacterium]
MGIGVSLLLIAAGAILTFGITVESESFLNLNTIGIILMVVGAIGGVITAVMSSRGGSRTISRERETVYRDREPDREVIREEDR